MNEQMEFPNTFDEFADYYGFKDSEEIYTNGSMLIPIFRVKQWLEHDNKLRRIETDTAYECGKHATKWIPVSERLPKAYQECLFTVIASHWANEPVTYRVIQKAYGGEQNFIAWMPLPEPYKAESEDKE